ncbi:MAG: phosphoribosyltransferase, partial [Acutalibacteraceae bacterium]|nr:phosphoribosyltransferase [Acutalibacteraceae bacterium]
EILKDKKVLIIDDVLTSGETLKACLMLVLSAQPKYVELLVLSTKQDLKELENRFNTVLKK